MTVCCCPSGCWNRPRAWSRRRLGISRHLRLGRHGVLHEEQFFELADDLPVKIEFLLHEDQAEMLLQLVRDAKVDATYARYPASFAVLGKN